MTSVPAGAPCPCGGTTFGDCCGPFLLREAWPDTAEQLMRSRYTAFAVRDAEYLLRTWHPRTRPETVVFDDRRWTDLQVTAVVDGGPDDLMGIVAFTARFESDGRRDAVFERSAFVRRGGRWVYLAATPEEQ